MPIQCTDKTDEQAEELFKPRVIQDINRGASCITSITPRGVGQDEDNNSVESLSKFNVKFPPTDNDSAFLQSTQEKPTVPCTGITENMLQDHHFNLEHRDRAVNLSKLEPNSFEARGVDLMTSALQSLTTVDKTNPPNHANMPVENTRDKTCLKAADTGFTFIPKHTNQGSPEAIFPLEAAGTTVRGPHQVSFYKYCTFKKKKKKGSDADKRIAKVSETGIICSMRYLTSLFLSQHILSVLLPDTEVCIQGTFPGK